MKISIIAVGTRMPAWVQTAWHDYQARFPREFSLILHEVKPESRTQGKTTQQIMQAEAERIQALLTPREPVIALDENGRDLDSMTMASQLTQWRDDGHDITFVIGGPDGLDASLKQRCHARWRLSSLTLAHPLVRVILAEQLYRCWSIMNNHPYHRA